MKTSPEPNRKNRNRVPEGLAALHDVVLNKRNHQMLERAGARCNGSPTYRARKRHELETVLQLSQMAPPGRLSVNMCDLTESLRIGLTMDVPVPCRDEAGNFAIVRGASLGLIYREQAICLPQPGYSYITILYPMYVWHANVARDVTGNPLCLGHTLPVGIPCVELLLLTYGALSMQSVMIDERNHAGVLNADAARWWQDNTQRIPLTRTPFLARESAA